MTRPPIPKSAPSPKKLSVVLIGVIPMAGYNIDKDSRDNMYRDLNRRRADTANVINDTYEEENNE